jgi:hypothetical protein
MAQIQPVDFPILGTATELILKIVSLDLEATTAQFNYQLLSNQTFGPMNAEKKVIADGFLSMNESEYSSWGADNQYCFQWAANKLGLTLI